MILFLDFSQKTLYQLDVVNTYKFISLLIHIYCEILNTHPIIFLIYIYIYIYIYILFLVVQNHIYELNKVLLQFPLYCC